MSGIRPTSPHLSIYRLPTISIFSITHRIAGLYIFIYMMAMICLWLIEPQIKILDSKHLLKIVLFFTSLFNFAVAFHISAGIRYLLWGMGFGVNLNVIKMSNFLLIIAILLLGGISSYILFQSILL